jgi:hypothetical protein
MAIPRRLAKVVTLIVLAVTLLVGVAAVPVEAGTTGTEGQIGSYSVAPVTCRHKIWGQTQNLDIYAPSPRVVAANRYAGTGNDPQWVRYAVLLRDYRTLQTVAVTNWSDWVAANDNYVSTWNGGTSWTVSALNNRIYRIDYLVEWYSGNTKVGVAAHYADNVHYYDYANVKYTGLTACFRYQ